MFTSNNNVTNVTRLTTSNSLDSEPSVSPDGKKIAFQTRYRSGSGGDNIWRMNADGSGQKNVSYDPNHRFADDGGPAWQPIK